MELSEPLKIAYYVTGHGLGHATRVLEVCKALIKCGHFVVISTAAPHAFFQQQLPSEGYAMRLALLDCGAFQLDAFTVDMKRSLEEYHRVAGVDREDKLAEETAWLQSQKFNLVVSDVVPLACTAAAAAGIPSACVTNFSWDFVYSEYLTSVGSGFRRLVWQIAEDYAQADLLLRLPGYCPMPAFREVVDVPLVVRKAQKTPAQVRAALGVSPEAKLLVFMYGGQPPGDWELRPDSLPDGWICVVCSNGKPPGNKQLPHNFLLAPADAYTPDLIAAASCVLGKIGYGSVSECLAHAKPLIFVRRDFFNEEPFLRKQLEIHGLAVEIQRRDFLMGSWRTFIQHAANLCSSFRDATNGADVVAELLEDLVAEKQAVKAAQRNSLALRRQTSTIGSARLRDAVVFGYIMHRHALQEKVEVPEWYMKGNMPGHSLPTSPSPSPSKPSPPRHPAVPLQIDILPEDRAVLKQCEDTRSFLVMLAGLKGPPTPGELPEIRAAHGLFRPDADIWVCRAPGRLDVMGGIADYSGSLVLQMPIAQACHVAAQAHPPGTPLTLWNHITERHRLSGVARPVIRIVSLNADSTNRGHAFDMDLAELKRDGKPLPYEDAQKFFKSDPPISWAAYVAGALLVLMHETEAVFESGLSLLVSSDVPDGKGVSSSAALEVAAMSAIAAAYSVPLDPVRLAALCQKVENLVVGAPCGIMDQMASVLGEKDSLLALRCQPADVLPAVGIPPTLKFWGVDSGLRHSVGGQDYGSVRTAAFMGLKIISDIARKLECGRSDSDARPLSKEPSPVGSGYLANLEPGEFRDLYELHLPEKMLGSAFLEQYGEHWDAATRVQPHVDYPVRQATMHPVHENFRVEAFEAALASSSSRQANVLGSLMYQSHASYGHCGLGSKATDRLVELVRHEAAAAARQGKPQALFGAKITGGGSGGTVCILGRNDAEGEAAVAKVVDAYSKETGWFAPNVFSGSSLGAAAFGKLRIKLKSPKPSTNGC